MGITLGSGTSTADVLTAKGTATVASGDTSVTVTHGLTTAPANTDIWVVPTNSMGLATNFWTSDFGATTFKINVNADPGATTATFAWGSNTNG